MTDIDRYFGTPEFTADPAPHLAKMRAQGPLVKVKVPIIGTCWATTSDAVARAVLKDEVRFARNPANAGGRDMARMYWWLPRSLKPLLTTLLAQDGEAHKRLRKAVDGAFARMSIEDMKPELEKIAERLLADLPTGKPVDLVSTYARALPLEAICELLGIAPNLRQELSRAIAPISGPTNVWTILRGLPGLKRANRLLRAEIQRHAAHPSDTPGLLPLLVAQNHEPAYPVTNYAPLTEEEILAMAFMLFVAGHETTLHLISDATYSLAQDPSLASKLLESPALFVEEMFRFHSPVMMTKPLFVRETMEFQGTPLKQGDKILALLAAANYDPNRFDDPDTLCPHRRPNAHLTFGFGPHVCLGMQLARAEAQVALTTLVKRYPNMRLANPSKPPNYSKRFGLRGLSDLKVILGSAS